MYQSYSRLRRHPDRGWLYSLTRDQQYRRALHAAHHSHLLGTDLRVQMTISRAREEGRLTILQRASTRSIPHGQTTCFTATFLLVSLQHPLVSSGTPGETPWNSSFWGGSEPCLRLFWGQNRQNTGYFAGIPGKPRYTWKIPGYRADFLNFAPDFAPDQLSDSGKLASFPRETREKQNGAPNTLWFPWKLPETQSAGDPLVSLWVAGNPRKGQLAACGEASDAARRRSLYFMAVIK